MNGIEERLADALAARAEQVRPASRPAAARRDLRPLDLDDALLDTLDAPVTAGRRRWGAVVAVAAAVALLAAGAVAASGAGSAERTRPAAGLSRSDLPRVLPPRSAWGAYRDDAGSFGDGHLDMTLYTDLRLDSGDLRGRRGTCTVFGAFGSRDPDVGPTPSLDAYAAAGCRRGLVTEPTDRATDPSRPFGGTPAPVDVGRCARRSTDQLTTEGGLTASTTTFTCRAGTLQQWVFPGELVWSLDGGRGVADLVATAARAEPWVAPTVPLPLPPDQASRVPAHYPGQTSADTAVLAGGEVLVGGISVIASPLTRWTDSDGASSVCSTVTRRDTGSRDVAWSDLEWSVVDPAGTSHGTMIVNRANLYPAVSRVQPGDASAALVCFGLDAPAAPGQYEIAFSSPEVLGATRGVWIATLGG